MQSVYSGHFTHLKTNIGHLEITDKASQLSVRNGKKSNL
ncbi:hypothetical protein M899_2261 [Bacteriovorax sp. BSW11_IV]|nr:hypothetical protein M899_2261 [Bacteriovorax sp. BSW11_IV]